MAIEIVRYEEAFKRQVIGEIASGKISQTGAAQKYGIKGKSTIQKWLKKCGANHVIAQVVTINMENRRDKISELEREKQQLESALAQAHLKNIALEELIGLAEKKYKIPIKKNFGGKRPSNFRKRFNEYSLSELCRCYGFSRQGFYKRRIVMERRQKQGQRVLEEVRSIRRSQSRVGGRKLHKMLSMRMGRDRLFELLRHHELLVKRRRSGHRTTYAGINRFPNRIKGRPEEETKNVLVSDITYVRTSQGFSYLSLVTHAKSRKILGYALRQDLSAAGPICALEMAINQMGQRQDVIHHSDQGYQYGSRDFVNLATKHNIMLSMTEEDHVYENALAERVNGILKDEFLLGDFHESHRELLPYVAQSIQTYNDERLHTSLGYKTPSQSFT